MPNIQPIIRAIDDYLVKNKKSYIGAVEANILLAKAGLLRNSTSRPGKPLRDLLRKGAIPHAIQQGGKGSEWIIPKSEGIIIEDNNSVITSEKTTSVDKSTDLENSEADNDLIEKLESARLNYKPEIIKFLLIAEAPPDSLDRFFYYENVKEHDYLFLGIANSLYPEQKNEYLASGRESNIKGKILKKFQGEGFYLIDLSELPLSLQRQNLYSCVRILLKKMRNLVDLTSIIIPIKANVYEIVRTPILETGYQNFIDISIPFPGQGWQKVFHDRFEEALIIAGYK